MICRAGLVRLLFLAQGKQCDEAIKSEGQGLRASTNGKSPKLCALEFLICKLGIKSISHGWCAN